MKPYKFKTENDLILLFCSYTVLLLSLVKTVFSVYLLFFFCFGLSAMKIKDSFTKIFKLQPDSHSLSALLCIVTFLTVTASYITGNIDLSDKIGGVILSVCGKSKEETYKDTLVFCLSVISCLLTGITVLFITNSVGTSLEYAYTLLCVCSVCSVIKRHTDRKKSLSVCKIKH